MEVILPLLIANLLLAILIALLYIRNLKLKLTILTLEISNFKENQSKEIKQAINKSRSVLKGQLAEKLMPLLRSDFDINDMTFLGNPIDYIVFDGMTEALYGEEEKLKRIVLVEIKTGASRLSKVQKLIEEAVQDKRVEFRTIKFTNKELNLETEQEEQ